MPTQKVIKKGVYWIRKNFYLYAGVFDGWGGVGGVPDPGGESEHPIADVLMRVLNWLLSIFGVLAVISFIIAGFFYLTSQGEYKNVERSKKAATAGVIGLVIGLMGYVVVLTINSLLGGSKN